MADIIVAGDNGTNAVITTAPSVEVVVGGALIGPPGVAGANGAPGVTGPQGIQGITGPQGIQGVKGDKGTFPYFNVQDYGATGDGVHDDTTNIQSAIVAAAIIGGTVFFPSGTYLITTALTMYTAVSLLGVGSEATIITQSSTAQGALVGTDIASVTISGILFDGPGSGTANGIDFGWSLAGNLPFLHFFDVWVRQFGGSGIALMTPIVSHFDRVIVQNNGKHGFDFYHAGTSCTFTSCWARTNLQAGYHFFESVYMNLSGCASDNNGINYLVESAQSIGFYSCGSEGALTNGGLWNGFGWKISNSSVIDLNACWVTDNRNVAVWITDGSQEVKMNVADNSPNGTAVNFIKTDVSTNSTIYEQHNTTANSLSPGTVNIMNDGALGVLVKDLYVKNSNGTLHLSAATDASEFNLSSDTSGTLSLFGSGGTVLSLSLLDGTLQLQALTATTVPYLDASKKFASSAVTPTELGYLSGVTSALQTQLGLKAPLASPTFTGVPAAPTAAGGTNTTQLATTAFVIANALSNPMTAIGDLIQGTTAGAPARLASVATGNVLISGGVTTASSWGKVGISTHVSGLGTGVATALAVNTGSAGAIVLFNGAGGTPTSLTLTNATGLVASTGTTATGTPSATTFLRGDNTWATPAGSGTVTATGGALTANALVLGAGTTDTKVVAGIITDGVSQITLGVNTTTLGKLKLFGNTSGDATVQPAAVAGTATVITLPAVTGTLATLAGTETLTNKTLTSPTLTTPALGTPSALVLTNATLLPISGITGLGTGVATLLAAASSGTGALIGGTTPTIATPVINGLATGTGIASANTVSTIMTRDASGNANVINMFEGFRTTATAAGTTTLTITDTQIQEFTGATTQTVKLPTTSIPAGAQYIIINSSTGIVTVQSSGANTIITMAGGTVAVMTALVATPTTAANWNFQYMSVTAATGKKATVNNNLTLAGTDGTTMTFPGTSATVARTDAANTFTGVQTTDLVNQTAQAITVTTNAGTADVTHGSQKFTNSSAATMAITLATASAVDGQTKVVRVYDFSAVAQTIGWTNTENSTVSVPTTSNGSTTLPLTVGFIFNGATSKWRCVASV